MLELKKQTKMPLVALLFLAVAGIVIMLLPLFTSDSNSSFKLPILSGTITLWVSIIIGYLLMFLFYRKQKGLAVKGRIGMLSFFRNKWGTVADLVLIASVTAIVIMAFLRTGTVAVFAVLFGLVFISANCHCVFNGRVFNTINQNTEERGK